MGLKHLKTNRRTKLAPLPLKVGTAEQEMEAAAPELHATVDPWLSAGRVEIAGLRNKFDGKHGTPISYNPSFGSYTVELDDKETIVVQPIHLRKVHRSDGASISQRIEATGFTNKLDGTQSVVTVYNEATHSSEGCHAVDSRHEAMMESNANTIAALRAAITDLESRLVSSAANDRDLEAKLSAFVESKLKGSTEADLESGASAPLSPLTGGTSMFIGNTGDKGVREDGQTPSPSSASVSSSLTCFGVIYYKISQTDSQAQRIAWALCALSVATVEIFAMMSVIALSSSPRCVSNDDCEQGQVCAFNMGSDGQEHPSHCEDCDAILNFDRYKYLYEGGAIFNGREWKYHPSGKHIFFELPSSGNETLMQSCQAQLDDAYGFEDFSQCLWWQMEIKKITWATYVVLIVTVYMITAALMTERQSQLFDMHARVAMLGRTDVCGKHQLPVWIIAFTELLLDKVLITSVMCSAMWLIMTTGMGPADILLNGAALTFVLTLDEEVVNFLVSEERRELMLATLEAGVNEGALTGDESAIRGQVRCVCGWVTFTAYFQSISYGVSCAEVSGMIIFVSVVSLVVSPLIEDMAAEIYTAPRKSSSVFGRLLGSLTSSAAGALVYYILGDAFLQ